MKKYLLDTNTIIYALNEGFKFPDGDYFISIISEIELLSYPHITEYEEKILQEAIANFTSVDLNQKIKTKTIEIRKNTKLKLPDSIIVASAILNNTTLVTSDKQLLNLDFVATAQLSDLKQQ